VAMSENAFQSLVDRSTKDFLPYCGSLHNRPYMEDQRRAVRINDGATREENAGWPR